MECNILLILLVLSTIRETSIQCFIVATKKAVTVLAHGDEV